MTVICEASQAEWDQRRATWLASIGMTMDDIRAHPPMRQSYYNTLWHEYRLANQWFVQTCYLASEPSAIDALWNKAVRAGYLRAYADVLCYERDPLTGKILHLAYHDFDAIQTIRQAIHLEEEAARDDPMGLFCDASYHFVRDPEAANKMQWQRLMRTMSIADRVIHGGDRFLAHHARRRSADPATTAAPKSGTQPAARNRVRRKIPAPATGASPA